MLAAGLTFLTPLGALVALAALVPLTGLAVTARRAERVARVLRPEPVVRCALGLPVALPALAFAFLGVAAAQPALRTTLRQDVRTQSQIFFVVDVSRSMAGAQTLDGRTRLARAHDVVARLHASVPDVPSGLAGLTDRVLPYLFPTASTFAFDETLRRSVLVETPPPQQVNTNATTFAALAAVARDGFFQRSVQRRTCVLVTDAETRSYSTASVAEALAGPRGCRRAPGGHRFDRRRLPQLSDRRGRLAELRPDAREQPALAVDRNHAEQRRPAPARLRARLPEARPGRAARPAVVSARDRRHALRDDERRQRLRTRRHNGQGALAVQADKQRTLQELRHRREPRARLLRRPSLPQPAQHAARCARPERREGSCRHGAEPGRAERGDELRLLRDERADLREPPRHRRRRRVGIRDPRVRHGLYDRSQAGVADPVLDRAARLAVLASCVARRRRRCGLDADDGRHDDEHPLLRHRLRDAALFPRSAPRGQSAHRLADRG